MRLFEHNVVRALDQRCVRDEFGTFSPDLHVSLHKKNRVSDDLEVRSRRLRRHVVCLNRRLNARLADIA